MVRDPREGTDKDGFITTGADISNVVPPYTEVIDDVIVTVVEELGDGLRGLYLYGSVATGQAVPPTSDLDLAAVVMSGTAAEACEPISARLSERHRAIVRSVWIGPALLDELMAETIAGHADRCFIKHYCVLLTGEDLRPSLPRCPATPELARGFNANLPSFLEKSFRRLDLAGDEAAFVEVAQTSAKRLLMAAAVALSTIRGDWTTDRVVGSQMIADEYPDRADEAATALRWSSHAEDRIAGRDSPAPDEREIRVFLDDFGTWLVDELEGRLSGSPPP